MASATRHAWKVGVSECPPYVMTPTDRLLDVANNSYEPSGTLATLWKAVLALNGQSVAQYVWYRSLDELRAAALAGNVDIMLAPVPVSRLSRDMWFPFARPPFLRPLFPFASDKLGLVRRDDRAFSVLSLGGRYLRNNVRPIAEVALLSILLGVLLHWLESRHERLNTRRVESLNPAPSSVSASAATSSDDDTSDDVLQRMGDTLQWSFMAVGGNSSAVPFKSAAARTIAVIVIILSSIIMASYLNFVKDSVALDYRHLSAFTDRALDGKRVGVVRSTLGASYVTQVLVGQRRAAIAEIHVYESEDAALRALTGAGNVNDVSGNGSDNGSGNDVAGHAQQIDMVISGHTTLAYLTKERFSMYRKLHISSNDVEHHWLSACVSPFVSCAEYERLCSCFAAAAGTAKAEP